MGLTCFSCDSSCHDLFYAISCDSWVFPHMFDVIWLSNYCVLCIYAFNDSLCVIVYLNQVSILYSSIS